MGSIEFEQRRFFKTLFREYEGWLFLSTKDRKGYGAWRDNPYRYPDNLNQMVADLNDYNERGHDVYFSVQLYREGTARDQKLVKYCPVLWADLDVCQPDHVFPQPSIALESSPGRYQGFWILDTPLKLEEATAITKAIAYRYADQGADKGGWDGTQVLRIPGTVNLKPAYAEFERWEVTVLWSDPTPYPRRDFDTLASAPQKSASQLLVEQYEPFVRMVDQLSEGTDPRLTAQPPPVVTQGTPPPIRLSIREREVWDQTPATVEDRSSWCFRMASVLKERGLSDRMVVQALIDHPIYLDKADEKWGGRSERIEQDILHCCEVWARENSKGAGLNLERRASGSGDVVEPYHFVQIGEIFGKDDVFLDPLVDGILWQGKIHWVFGAGGVGKSLFIMAQALHIAAGRRFHDRKVTQGSVLFYSEDTPHSGIEDYTMDLAEIYGIDPKAIPLYINRHQGLRVVNDDGVDEAMRAYRAFKDPPLLVIYDSCETIVPSDKFSTAAFDPFTRLVREQAACGSAVVVIDHTNRREIDMGGGAYLEKLYGGLPKTKFSDIAWFLEGSFQGGAVYGRVAKFRGLWPPALIIQFNGDTGFTIKDDQSSLKLSENEKKVTAWLNTPGVRVRWRTIEEHAEGVGLPVDRSRRILRRLAGVRWVEREVIDGTEMFRRAGLGQLTTEA